MFAERWRDERTIQQVVIHNHDSSVCVVIVQLLGQGDTNHDMERLTRGEGTRHREPGGSADCQISVQRRVLDLQVPKGKNVVRPDEVVGRNGGKAGVVVVAVR